MGWPLTSCMDWMNWLFKSISFFTCFTRSHYCLYMYVHVHYTYMYLYMYIHKLLSYIHTNVASSWHILTCACTCVRVQIIWWAAELSLLSLDLLYTCTCRCYLYTLMSIVLSLLFSQFYSFSGSAMMQMYGTLDYLYAGALLGL